MRILVAIPVYNEQKYVDKVLAEVSRYADDILIVDDGSSDATPCMIAKHPVDVVRHKENLGYGRSIQDAFRWAQCYGYDWLITMDCDEQHEPRSLPDFYEAIKRDDADVISGSRYLNCQLACDLPPEDRRHINMTVTHWVNDHLDMSITDAFCGFKAFRVSSLHELEITQDGYAIPLQFWVQAAAHDLRVSEVPIRLIYNDPNRSFGGKLDDAAHRIAVYREVFCDELAKYPDVFNKPCDCLLGHSPTPGEQAAAHEHKQKATQSAMSAK
ncbi:glycosyltransferase family 2 protein [Poriferisphaera sp. WC338]|uniref:glycosyltransferase family 2 protein n=1 Tax=Poriferisphaera sp. WC338 TaxID=3425129 RepID=UPI003D81C367